MNTESLKYAEETKNKIEKKADENKKIADRLLILFIVSTSISPVLILISDNFYFSKLFPVILTTCSAIASAWIQIRKPQDRWALYRTAQREIEFEIDQYRHKNGKYKNNKTMDKLLTDAVSKRALKLHYQWLPIVPKLDDISKKK